jgi:PEGA domain
MWKGTVKLLFLSTHAGKLQAVARHLSSREMGRRRVMIQIFRKRGFLVVIGLLLSQFAFPQAVNQPSNQGSNKVLGEVELVGATDTEKNAGVFIDGQYLGYLKELKGSKKILLLPGEHDLAIREDGYHDFSQKLVIHGGEKQTISVKMTEDPRFKMPSTSSEIKFSVTPDRAAVFVDGQYAGHAGEFGGHGRGLLVAPGHRKITVSLSGYQSFDTEVDLAPNQKFEIKTDLLKEGATQTVPQ